jgi:hypothetical protein
MDEILRNSCRPLGGLCNWNELLIRPHVGPYGSARGVGPGFRRLRVGQALLGAFSGGSAWTRTRADESLLLVQWPAAPPKSIITLEKGSRRHVEQ